MKTKSNLLIKKRPKTNCEINGCDVKNSKLLHRHHIIHRTELNTNNSDWNTAILCANHHIMTHTGELKIIGVFPSTSNIYGRMLVYVKDGVCNVPALEHAQPYYQPSPEAMSLFIKEEK